MVEPGPVDFAGFVAARYPALVRSAAHLPETGHDPAAGADLAVDVRAALGRLPWAQRAVLVLRYFDDLTEAQTAETLGCSVGTVKSRANRALASLRSSGLIEMPQRTETS